MTSIVRWTCPLCRAALVDAWRCPACGRVFAAESGSQPDFRIAQPLVIEHTYRYDPAFGRFPWDRVSLAWPNAAAGVAMDAAWDATERQMLSALPAAKPGQIALDVGCGEVHQRFRAGLTRLGYLPVGVDIAGSAPDALADAHRLPFADASLDVIMTSAVFEHLKHPHLAMSEMARVLRPGGRILGSIAFGEPFHISYFHHSPLAVFEILDSSDLDATVFVLSDRYSAFYAHLEMGFAGQRIPKSIHGIIARAVREVAVFPARVKSIVQRSPQHLRLARSAFARSHTASVGFIAHRRSDAA